MAKRLGELLLENGIITKEQLLEALKYQKARGVKLGQALLATGAVTDEELITTFIAKQLEGGSIGLNDLDLDSTVVDLIPVDIAQKYNIIAVNKAGRTLTVAIADPKNLFVLDAVKFLTGCTIKPVLAPDQAIKDAIKLNYTAEVPVNDILGEIKGEDFEIVEEDKDADAEELNSAIADAPVVKLVNHLIMEAVRKGASDIHIETYQRILRVRYRIDGKLVELPTLPYRLRPSIISRIKIMADLDISERRMPQDGRIKIKVGNSTVDIRVSTVPAICGEKVVMRILDSANLVLDMKQLNIPEPGYSHIVETLHSPFGMFLVTGPTGSGKTTTLYSALCLLNQPHTNIMTVEDPVEYNIDGINQINVNAEIGLTFAAALRSFLRQDPDIVMVGEIRDLETAEIAVKAALTGHLVFSTLHTNNSVATIARLIDMGVEPFLVASSVRTVVAQRLVRKICPNCKEPVTTNLADISKLLGVEVGKAGQMNIFHGKGCGLCNNTGFKGRCGLYEVLPITAVIQDLITHRASFNEIRSQAIKEGMKPLRAMALEKLAQGVTTVEEVLGATESR